MSRQKILENVRAALQDAEEMHGGCEGKEYFLLMEDVQREAQERMGAYAARELEDALAEVAALGAEVARKATQADGLWTIPSDLFHDLQTACTRWKDAGEALVRSQRRGPQS